MKTANSTTSITSTRRLTSRKMLHTSNSVLAVYPENLHFRGIESNVAYVMTISVRNQSSQMQRIRFSAPNNPAFRIKYDPQSSTAPGLDVRAEVELFTTEATNLEDSISVSCGSNSVPIKLTASVPSAHIVFNSLVNLGQIVFGQPFSAFITLENHGFREGEFHIEYDEKMVAISPTRGTIGPLSSYQDINQDGVMDESEIFHDRQNSSFPVKIELHPKELGVFRTIAKVFVPEEGNSDLVEKVLDINAIVVEQKMEIELPEANEDEEISFGTVYYGQERCLTAVLTNRGPHPAAFHVSIVQHADSDGIQAETHSDYTDSRADSRHEPHDAMTSLVAKSNDLLIVTPSQGTMEPYSKQILYFKFMPKRQENKQGFKAALTEDGLLESKEFRFSANVECSDTRQDLQATFFAKAVKPAISLSDNVFDFGNCPTNDRRDIQCTITNRNQENPVSIKFTKVAFFNTSPSQSLLSPGQSQRIILSYLPTKLGPVSTTTTLSLENGIVNIPIRLRGNCDSVGVKQLHSSLEQSVKDFVPEYKWVKNLAPVTAEEKSTTSTCPKWIEKVAHELQEAGRDPSKPMSEFTLSVEEMERMNQHKSMYIGYIRGRQEKREKQRKYVIDKLGNRGSVWDTRSFDPSHPDLGMDPRGVLNPPLLKISKIIEPLWLAVPVDDTGRPLQRGLGRDMKAVVKRKFKPHPTTQSEMRDCSVVLDPESLSAVNAGPTRIDFGRVCVGSENVKTFTVVNGLGQSILAALDLGFDELRGSSPSTQVIPPGATASFDIVFSSPTLAFFQKHITYTINGIHLFKFAVFAQVVPITVDLSTKSIHFQFGTNSIDFSVREPIEMHNPGNAPAVFHWVSRSEAIQVEPSEGQVEPFSSLQCHVVLKAGAAHRYQEDLLLKVIGGPDQTIRCKCELPEVRVSVPDRRIDFGIVAVGMKVEQSVVLRNGSQNAVFRVSSLPRDFSVLPDIGMIQAGESQELLLQLHSSAPQTIDTAIVLTIRGGRAVRIPVFAQSVVPEVVVEESEINFGQVILNSTTRFSITLTNTSQTSAILFLDFSSYPEFAVVVPKDRQPSMDPHQEVKSIVAVRSKVLQDDEDEDMISQDLEAPFKIYKLHIQAESSLVVQLEYTPRVTREFAFSLPLSIAGVSSPMPGLVRRVSASAVKPRLKLSEASIDFGMCVVLRDLTRGSPHHTDLTLTNADQMLLSWSFDEHVLSSTSDFRIEPISGQLVPGDSKKIRLSFLPVEPQDYSAIVPLYLDGQRDRPYVSIQLHGCAMYPKLEFDPPEVVLPVIPLNAKAIVYFTIINRGYDSLELKYRLPSDSQIPFSLEFPEGQFVGVGRERLLVQVVFSGKRSVSFTAKVDFMDNEGNRFSVPITATADNCLLTTYAYVLEHRNEMDFIAKDASKAIQFGPRQMSMQTKKSTPSLLEIETPRVQAKYSLFENVGDAQLASLDRACEALSLWITSNLSPRVVVDKIPDDFINTNGKLLFDMVESLLGKPVSGRLTHISPHKRERVNQLHRQYNEILHSLKSMGALLNFVRPQDLFGLEDFERFSHMSLDHHMSSTSLGTLSMGSIPTIQTVDRKEIDQAFSERSKQAWLAVLLQIIKVLVLCRVTQNQFRTLAGIDHVALAEMISASQLMRPEAKGEEKERKKDKEESKGAKRQDKDPLLFGSNIMTASESLLLRWVNYHVEKVNPLPPKSAASAVSTLRIKNFDTDLSDGMALCCLLLSHIPSFAETTLSNFQRFPNNPDHAKQNNTKVLDSLRQLGIEPIVKLSDLLNPVSHVLLLFVLQLYQTLPQFIPKTTVLFQGSLQETITKTIELRNPTKQTIVYIARLQASEDFSVEESTIELPPQETKPLRLHYNARFSCSNTGLLTLISGQESAVKAATLVFRLQSDINTRIPTNVQEFDIALYEIHNFQLQVKNPFSQDGSFQVSLVQNVTLDKEKEPRAEHAKMKRKKTRVESVGSHVSASTSVGQRVEKGKARVDGTSLVTNSAISLLGGLTDGVLPQIVEPFWTRQTVVRLKPNSSVNVPLQFIGIKPGKYRCQVVLLDENVGEFMVEVIGNVKLPTPAHKISWSCEVGSVASKEIPLDPRNSSLDRIKLAFVERFSGSIKTRQRELVRAADASRPHSTNFRVEVDSPYYTVPNSVVLADTSIATPVELGGALPTNKLRVQLHAKGPGSFPCKIILWSNDDIRLILIQATASTLGTSTTLEFSAPARQEIVQGIPIYNPSTVDWMLEAAITGSSYFSGPNRFPVPRSTTASYPLRYHPIWVSDEAAELTLANAATGDRFVYELKGVANEPLAEDHIVVRCKAREQKLQQFRVENDTSNVVQYRVESDLPHVSGNPTIDVPANSEVKYELRIHPQLGGMYSGSVTFVDEDGHFIWYTVELHAEAPEAEEKLTVEALVRKATAIEISLGNPHNEPVEFEVSLLGEGLMGDSTFVLGPRETAVYELVFAPLISGVQVGAITFVNEKMGEFWYELELSALEPPPKDLAPMTAQVGTSAIQEISIDNPSKEHVILSGSVSNKINFTLIPSQLPIAPYATAKAKLQYSPSSIGMPESTELSIGHPKVGIWRFRVSGMGSEPSEMEALEIAAAAGQTASSILNFRNPFPNPIQVTVELVDSKDPVTCDTAAFQILRRGGKSSITTLDAFNMLNLSVSFRAPSNQITQKTAEILISSSRPQLSWRFPLRGICEVPAPSQPIQLTCKARELIQRELSVVLSGLSNLQPNEQFSFHVEVPDEYKAFYDKSIIITQLFSTLDSPSSPARYEIIFQPLKTVDMQFVLLVNRQFGGRWRFAINFIATDPDPDDVIHITASLHRTTSVAFRLANQFPETAPFHAFFTPGSPHEFSIQPTNGILAPAGSEGSEFVLSFTPHEYGKVLIGKLVIQTEDMQWLYEVRGGPQDYKIPKGISKIDNKLDQEATNKLQTRKSPLNASSKR